MRKKKSLKVIYSCMAAAIFIIGAASCATTDSSIGSAMGSTGSSTDNRSAKDGAQNNINKSDIQDLATTWPNEIE